MKLKSLSSNQNSFHAIKFKDGINIILAKKHEDSSANQNGRKDTYNGVGKSLLLRLVYFCLGSSSCDDFKNKLPDWEFILTFENRGVNYTVRRATDKQEKVILNGDSIKLAAYKNFLLKEVFKVEPGTKNLTWNTLLLRFIRQGESSYANYLKHEGKESEYQTLISNSFLLGLDTHLVAEKKGPKRQANRY